MSSEISGNLPQRWNRSVSDEGTRGHCGYNGQQEGFGASHFLGEDMKDNIKKGALENGFVSISLFKDSFEITPVCDIISQSMISVCFHLNKEVH